MRRKDRLRRHAVVAEEAVRRFQLSVIQRLWEALSGALAEPIREQPESSIQPDVAQIGVAELRRKGWNLNAIARHARRGSQPRSPGKMCRIVRGLR